MKQLLLCILIVFLSSCELFIGIDGKRLDGFVNFDYVRNRITNSYALLDWKENKNNFSWDKVTRIARKRVSAEMSAPQLMKVLRDTLATLKDAHVYFRLHNDTSLRTGTYHRPRFQGTHSGFVSYLQSNISPAREKLAQHYLIENTQDGSKKNIMMYGKLKASKAKSKRIGYLHIHSFIDDSDNSANFTTLQSWAHKIDDIVAKLMDTEGLILDLRQNGGGYPGNMLWIAGRFAKSKKHFMNTYMKKGPGRKDFAKPYKWYVEPQGPRQYTKPIVLITDGGTGSNGEYFTLAMRSFDYVTHFGQNTMGIMGYIMSFEMPNGWGFNYTTGYSVGFAPDNKEINYEQDGIPPESTMEYAKIVGTSGHERNGGGSVDPMLDKAIDILVGKL